MSNYWELSRLEKVDGREAVVTSSDFVYRVSGGTWVCVGLMTPQGPQYL